MVEHSRSKEKDKTESRVVHYTSFVLYRFLRALQQNRAQSRLLYLLNRNISQWIEGLKSSYVVCKAKWSRIESLLSCKHFSGDSSLFCLMFQCHIVICHRSTMTLEHMHRIWGWLHLEKCFFYTTWTHRQRKCMYERIVRDVSLILNEFTVTSLWYLWNNNMTGSLGEREMPWEREPQASVSTAFSSSPKLPACIHDSIYAR